MDTPLAGLKVLFAITKSNWGGAQAYVHTLAVAMKSRGADVAVALGGTGGEGASAGLLAARLEEAGIRVIFLGSFARDVHLLREYDAYAELLSVIREEKPDILHLNSSKAGGLGALAGRVAGVPLIVFTAHGWAHREPRNPFASAAIWLASWFTIAFSHRVIVVSKKDYEDAPAWFMRAKLVAIHNGVAPFPLRSRDEARKALASLSKGSELFSFWILATGELHPNKGFDVLIPAFIDIARAHPDAALVIMGEGESRARLESLIGIDALEGRVFLPGFVEDSRGYLEAADIVALPSRKEGLPLALLEAGLAGSAVVATDTGGVPDVITDGMTGLLAAPGDTGSLSRALTTLLDDKNKRTAYAEALKKKVSEDFSESAMLEKTSAIYASVLPNG